MMMNNNIITFRKYESSDSGLSYFFENSKIIMKPDITIDPSKASHKKGGIITYPEFDSVIGNERIISIEYCANCQDHQMHTMHSTESYYNIAKYFSEAIKIRFPAIKVLLKPIDTKIIKDFKESYQIIEKTKNINDKYKPVRIGALEILMCVGDKKNVTTLHSKLETNQWPNLEFTLDKISKFTPIIKLNLKLYIGENDLNNNEKELKDKISLKDIKINIYRLKFNDINDIKNIYYKELELISKSKGIKKFLETMRLMNHSYELNGLELRPFSSQFVSTYNIITPNNDLSKLKNKLLLSKNICSTSNSNNELNKELVYDIHEFDEYKGPQIKGNLKTDDNGNINDIYLPYDSYFIEILENKNFSPLGGIIKFNTFLSTNENVINKYLPLKFQKNAYVIILVNCKANESELKNVEYKLLSEATIYMKKFDNLEEKEINFGNQDKRIKIKENNKYEGRYEIVITPGRYLIEITKNGYDDYKIVQELDSGEKIITITMIIQKVSNINVSVYNFEKFIPLVNVFLKLTYANSSDYVEGVTDINGKFIFKSIRDEEGISIIAEKDGYFNNIRSYIGGLDYKVDEKKEISFILVRKNFIIQNNIIIMVAYSNLAGDNFDTKFNFSSQVKKYIDIEQYESQREHGIVSNKLKLCKIFYIIILAYGYNPEEDKENFGEIIRISLKVKNPLLLKHFEISNKIRGNGLIKYCCQVNIYTCNEIYQISPPEYSAEETFCHWDLGYFDIKNIYFYELGQLTQVELSRNLFFKEWLKIISFIVVNKLQNKLFDVFGFSKSLLISNNRYLYEPLFFNNLKSILSEEISNKNLNSNFYNFNPDFLMYFCNLFKNSQNLISYSIFKIKVSSNLKNFRDLTFTK